MTSFEPGRVGRAVRELLGSDIEVSRVDVLTSGVSNDSYRVRISGSSHPHEAIVVRMARPESVGVGHSIPTEYKLLEVLHDRGLPVPEPLGLDAEGTCFGRPAALYEWVDGNHYSSWKELSDRTDSTVLEAARRSYLETLVDIHNTDLPTGILPRDPRPCSAEQTLRAEYETWTDLVDPETFDLYPLLREVQLWLRDHPPSIESPGLVHGDYRLSNLLFEGGSVATVLDWEVCHFGDPAADLGFSVMDLWGREFGDRSAVVQQYQEAGGEPVGLDRLQYWELFGYYKFILAQIYMHSEPTDSRTNFQTPLSYVQLSRYLVMMGDCLERVREVVDRVS